MKSHPGEEQLALLAGDELPLLERWKVSRHVRLCAGCAETVEQFRRLRAELATENLPIGEAEWSRLEAEMKANIRLGLAAGAVVEAQAGTVQAVGDGFVQWRFAAVAASLAFVFGAGVWLGRIPIQQKPLEIGASQPRVEVRAEGVVLRQALSSSLELKSPEGSAAVRGFNWDGTARARYFDGETGQVTIHQVAWEGSDAP